MNVNSYLSKLAGNAIIRDSEKESIKRSISNLESRLLSYFGNQISKPFIFGSYSRNTILPRNMDGNSDIDYLILFKDSSSKPQTYLNKLNRFIAQYYSKSDVHQSNPTIVLSLNHIKFELVPAIEDWMFGLQIPAKASEYQDWISTNPKDFNNSLSLENKNNNSLIKPLVRLIKYWNACNRYPFESFQLEKMIIDHHWDFITTYAGRLWDYFYDFSSYLTAGFFAAQWKIDAVTRLKTIISEVKQYEKNNELDKALLRIQKLLPSV